MKNKLLLVLSLTFSSVIIGQITFGKTYGASIPNFSGIITQNIFYDNITNRLIVSASGYNGSSMAPGIMCLDTCGQVIYSNHIISPNTSFINSFAYQNGVATLYGSESGIAAGFMGAILNFSAPTGSLSSSNGFYTNATAIDAHIAYGKRLPNGEQLVTGYASRTGNFKDILFSKLDANGNVIWSKLTGLVDVTWENGWQCDNNSNATEYYFVGQNISFSNTNSDDIHLIKTDVNGNIIWENNIATPFDDKGYCLKVLANNDIIVAGTSSSANGNADLTILRLNSNGGIIWANKYVGNGNNNTPRNIQILPNGNLLFSGYSNSFSAGNNLKGMLFELDNAGNMVWQKLYGDPLNEDSFYNSVVVGNSIFTAGNTAPLSASNDYSITINKLSLNGSYNGGTCVVINSTFVKTSMNYVVFSASNIENNSVQLALPAVAQSTQIDQTILCGCPIASFTPQSFICVNQPISLINQSSNSPTSYTWSSTANNIPNPFLQNQTQIIFTTPGTYTLQLTAANCVGSDVIQKVIVVNPNPTITPTSNSPLCAGATLSLSAIGTGTFSWSGPSAFNSNLQNPTINNSQVSNSGNYTLSLINPSGCSSIGTVSVIVNPTPTISVSSNGPICSGSNLSLSSAVNSNLTWIGPSGFTSNLQSPTISNAQTSNSGIYSASTTNSLGCISTGTVNVIVSAIPNPSIAYTGSSPLCAGASASLSAFGATNYTWLPSINSSSSIVITPSTSTNYTLQSSNPGNCTNTIIYPVSVIPRPVISITGNSIICNGQSTQLNAVGAISYSWSPNLSNSISVSLTPSVSTTYSVSGTGLNGCTNTAIFSVLVNQNPTISISGNQTICVGQTTTLTANGANSYTWNAVNLSNQLILSPTVSTTINVVGTSALTGCSGMVNTTVFVQGFPTLTVVGNNAICSGQTTTLTALGASSCTWNAGAVTSSISIAPSSTTSYTVVGGNGIAGCTNTAVYQVTVSPSPIITINGKNNICFGNSSILTANGANVFIWNTGLTSTSIEVTPLTTTFYSVMGTNPTTGCSNSSTFTVNVNQLPLITVTGPDVICEKQNATLIAGGANTYTWNESVSSNSISISPLSSTTYTVVGQNTQTGCSATKLYDLSVAKVPTLSITGKTTICQGENLKLYVTGASNYIWENTSGNEIVVLTPTTNGAMSVEGFNDAGCKGFTSINYTVNPVTKASFVSDSTLIDCTYLYKFAGVSNTLINNYEWYLNGNFKSNANELYVPLEHNEEERIDLKVKNIYGCTSSFTRKIKTDNLFENLVYIPNTFTPNSDGLNDNWKVISECLENHTCYIYNRWGQLIYTLKNKTDSWDGMYKGELVKDDIYTFKLVGNFYNKKTFEKVGKILVQK